MDSITSEMFSYDVVHVPRQKLHSLEDWSAPAYRREVLAQLRSETGKTLSRISSEGGASTGLCELDVFDECGSNDAGSEGEDSGDEEAASSLRAAKISERELFGGSDGCENSDDEASDGVPGYIPAIMAHKYARLTQKKQQSVPRRTKQPQQQPVRKSLSGVPAVKRSQSAMSKGGASTSSVHSDKTAVLSSKRMRTVLGYEETAPTLPDAASSRTADGARRSKRPASLMDARAVVMMDEEVERQAIGSMPGVSFKIGRAPKRCIMKSIDAIVNEWKRKNLITDTVDTGPKRTARSPSPDPNETDDGDRSGPEDDIERILALSEKREMANRRRARTNRIRKAYEGMRSGQDRTTRDRLLNKLSGLESGGNAEFVDKAMYLVRNMAAGATSMEGPWASAIRVITDDAYGDLERAQFPLTAHSDTTRAYDEFLSKMPLGYAVRDALFDRGLLVDPPAMAPAWQEYDQYTYDPDQSQPNDLGAANSASHSSDDDGRVTDGTTGTADEAPSSPPREANDPLAPNKPLLVADLMDGVLRLVREYSATPNDSARNLADAQLVDGRHSPHAHSYELLHTLPETLLHPEMSVATYYSKASDRGVVTNAPATRAGSLMASLRLLVLLCFKIYIESTDDDKSSRYPPDDVRMLSLLEVCRSLHRTMDHPTISTALALTDGLLRYDFVRNMHNFLYHTDANDASKNGIMTKLKNMRELPPILAMGLGEQMYSRESLLVTLLIHVCEFVGDCLLRRLSSGLENEYFAGMQAMPIRPFPILQLDEIRPVPPAPPSPSLERDDSMSSESEASPILSIAFDPEDGYDSQATIEDSPS